MAGVKVPVSLSLSLRSLTHFSDDVSNSRKTTTLDPPKSQLQDFKHLIVLKANVNYKDAKVLQE